MFSRSRGQIRYFVHSGTSGTEYNASQDFIRIRYEHVWGPFGTFVISHEYGHAFHWAAIDPWIGYSCPTHDLHTEENSACAYVEGFADFFAVQVLKTLPPSQMYLSVYQLEANPWKFIGQGLAIEGAMAAVFHDLLDDAYSNDGVSGDDEAITLSGGQIADIMVRCRLHNPSTYLLNHADQFIYCTEGAVNNARLAAPSAYQSDWGLYGSQLSWDGGVPTLPNFSAFRTMWKFNLYGI